MAVKRLIPAAGSVIAAAMVLATACGSSVTDHQDAGAAPLPPQADHDRPLPMSPVALAMSGHDLSQSARSGARALSSPTSLREGISAVEPYSVGTIVAHPAAGTVVTYRRPVLGSETAASFANPTDRGGSLVFTAVGRPQQGWLEVLLPVRPNGTTGWIPLDDVELTINPYRIEVDASTYRLAVLRYGQELLTTTIAVGNGATPTPMGDFYLVELLKPSNPGGVYGPYAYGLSGYSDTLDSFAGGEGVIGIHGTNRPELLGQDVSHGCIRVENATITEMTEFLPLGTPVSIFRSET